MSLRLLAPSLDGLPAYVEALERGWSPDNIRGDVARREILERIAMRGSPQLPPLVLEAA